MNEFISLLCKILQKKRIDSLCDKFASKKLDQAVNILYKFKSKINGCSDVSHIVFFQDYHQEREDGPYSKILYALDLISNRVMKLFAQDNLYVSSSLVASVVLTFVSDNSRNMFRYALADFFFKVKNYDSGFLIFPLYNFGVSLDDRLAFSVLRARNRSIEVSVDINGSNITLSPQTNSYEKSIKLIESYSKKINGHANIDVDLIRHFIRSRPLRWLERNPVLFIEFKSFSMSYYENTFWIKQKILFATAFVAACYVLSVNKSSSSKFNVFNSSSVNNFETLDFKHFLLFESRSNKEYEALCVPWFVKNNERIELSDLNIMYGIGASSKTRLVKRLINDTNEAFEFIENQYLLKLFSDKTDVFKKIYLSLYYFKKSFTASSTKEFAIISLAMAFEILLTDEYMTPLIYYIIERVDCLLYGNRRKRNYVDSVLKICKIRGECVHTGSVVIDGDTLKDLMLYAQKAFVEVLVSLVHLLKSSNSQSSKIVSELLPVSTSGIPRFKQSLAK